jgi:hypothetical protein
MRSRQGDKGCDPCQRAIRTNRRSSGRLELIDRYSRRLQLIARYSGRLVSNRPC